MTARLLVCARDMGGTGPGQYLKGDVVDVREGDVAWGTLERLPDFVRLTIPDVDAGVLLLLQVEWEQRRRRIYVDPRLIDDVIAHLNGAATLTHGEMKANLRERAAR